MRMMKVKTHFKDWTCDIDLKALSSNFYLDTTGFKKLVAKGDASEVFYFSTLPTSPPHNLECEATENQLTFTWAKPTNYPDSILEEKYLYNFYYDYPNHTENGNFSITF